MLIGIRRGDETNDGVSVGKPDEFIGNHGTPDFEAAGNSLQSRDLTLPRKTARSRKMQKDNADMGLKQFKGCIPVKKIFNVFSKLNTNHSTPG